eukprot:TRINITY_DN20866_c0_g1_i1.p1 TRINITY_DN20866_c0_g1~~TRINITY_DN20866_c0_g1_i1.p1  ORF type:complete len:205 (+),score=32.98 TRINITY_DN20866_c0_g1_i1:100-714(+)
MGLESSKTNPQTQYVPPAAEVVVPPVYVPPRKLEPSEYEVFPTTKPREFVGEYYTHNLRKSMPQDLEIPIEVIHLVLTYAEHVLFAGDKIEVKDHVHQWYVCTVREAKGDMVYIHFEGWPGRWNQWIRVDSDRIAPMLTHTNGTPYKSGDYLPIKSVLNRIIDLGYSPDQASFALKQALNDEREALRILAESVGPPPGKNGLTN